VSAAQVARELGKRLEATRDLNAVLSWSQASLDAEAARIDAMPVAGALAGTPVAIKDNIVTLDHPTTCASRILEGYRSPFESTATRRLRDAGAMIACKANMDEFAMGSSTEHSAFGRVKNPLSPGRVPGGSSGGSAALVAAGVVPAALGSETGGSVRQPAAFCGIVGIKPSYGRVSRYGLVAFGSSLDVISVFGRTVDDASRVLVTISGHDPLDATTPAKPPMSRPVPRGDLRDLTIGLPREYFPADLDPAVRASCDRTVAVMRDLGATIREVDLPHSPYAVATYYIVAPAEAAANLARYDGVRYGPARPDGLPDVRALYRETRGRGFGAEVRRRILIGTYVLSAGYYDAYYGKAQAMRARIATDFRKVFDSGVDFLFTPSTPSPAFCAGEKTDDPVAMYLADVFTCPVSLAGLPGVSVPIGRINGLPLGGQIIAPYFADEAMLAVASAIEANLDATAEVR
jgi:aspartyl-tRNA(Asn)/glutamyl-tRNA(Gln) amidotransferase subunit A